MQVAYFDVTELQDEWDWSFFVDDVCDQLREKYPSLSFPNEKRWDNNETKVILENRLVEIGISEYCGFASVSVQVHSDIDNSCYSEDWSLEPLAKRFAERMDLGGQLKRVGHFSNGESVYELA